MNIEEEIARWGDEGGATLSPKNCYDDCCGVRKLPNEKMCYEIKDICERFVSIRLRSVE
jgi:hypothetical protein